MGYTPYSESFKAVACTDFVGIFKVFKKLNAYCAVRSDNITSMTDLLVDS